MVISFPAASVAPTSIGVLLDRCIGFLEGFEGDPEQCVAPLLQQLRRANRPGLLQLQIPDTTAPRVPIGSDFAYAMHASTEEVAFTLERHGHHGRRGLYYWSTQRFDENGRLWRTSGHGVADDFGNLVEVAS
ncbi:hypothetical protein [uncultured Variovorax sp.]|jgi:hypothetical protein|uniref:hypothetical protein n=1 Tax=uncultured Variovorax sp. TaxID=114708 RepID=UPI002611C1B3|nr:hypothetical protein [uncultured Variovorax sp.]